MVVNNACGILARLKIANKMYGISKQTKKYSLKSIATN